MISAMSSEMTHIPLDLHMWQPLQPLTFLSFWMSYNLMTFVDRPMAPSRIALTMDSASLSSLPLDMTATTFAITIY